MAAESGETRTIVGEMKFVPFLRERREVDDDKPRVALARVCYSRKRGQNKKNFSTAIARAEETWLIYTAAREDAREKEGGMMRARA